MATFDTILQQLQTREPLPTLYPTQTWDEALSRQIAQARDIELFGVQANEEQAQMNDACRAGLLLWNDDLEASHHIAQGIENATGSFWHAIMHRREGDAANSHYWWRRTGAHPAFADVYAEVMGVLQGVLQNETDDEAREFEATLKRAGTWVPMEFVARCEMARRSTRSTTDDWLRRIQVAEMAALLGWCRARMG